jgi:hypothetical protein
LDKTIQISLRLACHLDSKVSEDYRRLVAVAGKVVGESSFPCYKFLQCDFIALGLPPTQQTSAGQFLLS